MKPYSWITIDKYGVRRISTWVPQRKGRRGGQILVRLFIPAHVH